MASDEEHTVGELEQYKDNKLEEEETFVEEDMAVDTLGNQGL